MGPWVRFQCRRAARRAAAAAALVVVTAGGPSAQGGDGSLPAPAAGEQAIVVEVVLADRDELDRLVATGVDLDHGSTASDDRIVVHAVVTPGEAAALRAIGFRLGAVVFTPEDSQARLAEREAIRAQHRRENAALAGAESDVVVLRADFCTSTNGDFLSVEVKWSEGQTQPGVIIVELDGGPGTAIGAGGTQTLYPFVDAGVYLYHRGTASVASRPGFIRVTSPTGGTALAEVHDWLPLPKESRRRDPYLEDFVTSYMTPTELYDRIEQLHAEYPELTDIIELPYRTQGYRRLAQAVLGLSSPTRVAIDSRAWGHEGGNDIQVEFRDPDFSRSPLMVEVEDTSIVVSLRTDASGALASTAAQVVAAINADPQAKLLVRAYTYRGDTGNGLVASSPPINLSDGLAAPPTLSREPFTVRALRVGKVRDGSRIGVLAYAQEHAREWVPPLVAIETAERLLANAAHDGETRTLLNDLDIFIVPSVNPDGGHYSFYDDASQRRNMTNHCPRTDAADAFARGSWGVDINRNYDSYSGFDGYEGASARCTNDVFRGPAELSEPESSNIDWILRTFPNIRFSVDLHSPGNQFMWPPGAYALPGRIPAPRPTLEQEAFFWGAAERILTAIKRYRGLSVSPAQTGPLMDVLYSAAGNSGDMAWYKYGVYGWTFEVGTSYQPGWTEAHAETMEFANGLVELLKVARTYDKDHQRPASTLRTGPGPSPGTVDVLFEVSEPAAVFYTLDRSRPTFASTLYAAAGVREDRETLTVPAGTVIQWFSVDSAGNIEGNYNPAGRGENFNRATVR